jgi:hypothetical protein
MSIKQKSGSIFAMQAMPCQFVAVQHGIAADRFAREIVAFLRQSHAARSRQLNAKPLGHNPSNSVPDIYLLVSADSARVLQ